MPRSIGFIPSTVPGVWMDWTVTDIVKAWIESGQTNYGFIIDSASTLESNPSRDNVWPQGLNVGNINSWGILNSRQQSRGADPYHYVGGEVFSADKLVVLSPYLALISVVTVAAVVVKKKLTQSTLHVLVSRALCVAYPFVSSTRAKAQSVVPRFSL
jgi:hypothetical protein